MQYKNTTMFRRLTRDKADSINNPLFPEELREALTNTDSVYHKEMVNKIVRRLELDKQILEKVVGAVMMEVSHHLKHNKNRLEELDDKNNVSVTSQQYKLMQHKHMRIFP